MMGGIGSQGSGFGALDGKFNWVEKTEALKGLPMNLVQQVAMHGSDPMIKTLAVGEIDRRSKAMKAQMAQMAQPTKTVAEMVLGNSMAAPPGQPGMAPQGQQMQGGIGAMGQPQMSGPQPAVGIPMAGGGELSVQALIQRAMEAAEAARVQEFETFAGAREHIAGITGPYRQRLEAMMRRRSEAEPGRRRQELTDQLLSFGTPLLQARGPNFLNALGEGFAGLAAERGEVRTARDARENQEIEGEQAMMGLSSDELNAASGLFAQGRAGLAGVASTNSAGANTLGQLRAAQMYSSRPTGGGQGLSRQARIQQSILASATSVRNNAQTALRQLVQGVDGRTTPPAEIAAARENFTTANDAYLLAVQALRDTMEAEALAPEGTDPNAIVPTPTAPAPAGTTVVGGPERPPPPPPPRPRRRPPPPPPPAAASPTLEQEWRGENATPTEDYGIERYGRTTP